MVRAGDEVIVLDPCYDLYEPAIELAGGACVHVPLDPRDFSIDWDRLGAAVTRRTRMIVINSPQNPTGAVWSAADVERLAALTRDTEILVLSDEVYEHIVYDGRRHETVLRHAELAARSFVVSSFGKSYHCTGWRMGYCIAPRALTAELRKVHQYNTFSSVAPMQRAFAEMLRANPEHTEGLGAFYQAKRDHFAAQLSRTRLKALPVPGGYFQLVDYSAISDLPDDAFARWLCTERLVAAIPLSPFYGTPPRGSAWCGSVSPSTRRRSTPPSRGWRTHEHRRVEGHPRTGRHDLARRRGESRAASPSRCARKPSGQRSHRVAGDLHHRLLQRGRGHGRVDGG